MTSVISEVSDVAQAIGNTAVVFSLFFLYGQLRVMRNQAEDARAAQLKQTIALQRQIEASIALTLGQNTFSLIQYLESSENLSARKAVAALKDKPFRRWSKKDLAAADRVGRVFQVAAAFQRTGVLPERWLHFQYGGAMVRAWDVLEPYIADLRANTDREQRRDFEAVCREVRELGWFRADTQIPSMPSSLPKIGDFLRG